MAQNMERFRQAADSLFTAKIAKKANDKEKQKERRQAYRASVRELHDDIDTYYEYLWDDFGMRDQKSPYVRIELGRPRQENTSPHVQEFLSATMGVDSQSNLTVIAETGGPKRCMKIALGKIGVSIETSYSWLSSIPWVEVSVFDVYGKLDNQKEIEARTRLKKAFDGGDDAHLAIAQQLFEFVVGKTTVLLKNKAKLITAEQNNG